MDIAALDSIGAVPRSPDIPTYRMIFGSLHIWEGDGWKAESMASKTGCALGANLTGPMQTTYRGRDAQELLSRVSINDVRTWGIGRSKHLVMPDANGRVAAHGLAVRDSEEQFRVMASLPWPALRLAGSGLDVDVSYQQIFILQVTGPTSVDVIERLLGRSIRDLRFLGVGPIDIPGGPPGVELELSRIGMSGNLAYEIRGPYEHGPWVYDAVHRAGADFGIVRTGWRTYPVNHTEGGFPQSNVTFLASAIEDDAFLRSEFAARAVVSLSGSVDPADVRARMRTAVEVNWGWMARLDHDFIGREAVEAELAAPRRTTVTLRWSPEDMLDVFASQFEPGEEYTHFEFPTSPQPPAGGHADLVTDVRGEPIGVSSAPVYSSWFRAMLSQGTIAVEQAQVGATVIVHWGEHGRRIKRIRATVEPFPMLDLPRNRDHEFPMPPAP